LLDYTLAKRGERVVISAHQRDTGPAASKAASTANNVDISS